VRIIKSVGVFSVAKVMGAMYALLGLIFMPIFLLVGVAGSMAGGRSNPFGALGGLMLGILAPVFYGVIGFIGGAISAFLYNLMAKWLGGIEVEVQ
jgi:hypothetical protein